MNTDRQSMRAGREARWGLPCRQPVLLILTVLVGMGLTTGCGQLRFAPGEVQKQNAYLHHKTVQAAALKAHEEQTSETLQDLTGRAAQQSDAILAYYGLPAEMPPTQTVGEILSVENETLAQDARIAALQRPDPWDVADNLLELGIAVAGILGGVCGAKAAAALQTARQKSTALREVVRGNEIFKQSNPALTEDFKKAQAGQTETTRQLVAQMK